MLLRKVIDDAAAHQKREMSSSIFLLVILIAGQILLRAILRFWEELFRAGYENAFKKKAFGELLQRDYEEVTAVHSGEWMNRLTSDAVVIADGLATIVPGRLVC